MSLPEDFENNLFTSKKWLSVISKTYGIDFFVVANNDLSFLLPFCQINNYFSAMKSIPFSDYTLINYSEDFLKEALLLLKKTFPEYYIETTVINKKSPDIEGYSSIINGFLVQINIPAWKISSVWKDSYERNIRKALNYGIEIKVSNEKSSVEKFYAIHEQLRINKFNKLPQPKRFFNAIYSSFIDNDSGFFLEAWHKEKLLASWLILKHNETLYYKFGASDLRYLNMRPNDLLFRTLMQYGSENGFKTVDLGFSGASKSYEGLLRFKRKEGGEKLNFYHLEYFPAGFDKSRLEEKRRFLTKITREAVASGNLSEIRKISDIYYEKFA